MNGARGIRSTRRGRLALAACTLLVGIAAVGSIGDGAAAAGAPYDVTVPNGGFEAPAIANRTDVYRPTGGSWTFTDQAGVSRSSSTMSNNIPAFPEGVQVGFVQNAGKVVQKMWIEPGDSLTFAATQRRSSRTGLQSIAVVIDGIPQGAAIVPGDNVWTTHTVSLSVPAPRLVNVEIRGLTTITGQNRTAFLDAVSVVRTPTDIPDTGLPAQTQRGILDTRTKPMAAGVVGVLKDGDSEPALDTPALAFAQWGNVIFVGGKFANVQRGAGAPLEAQSYLAAFDKSTGAWIDTFRPTLNGTVWDLAMTADGKLIVGGQFTNVNGVADTAGLAALDPATGAVLPGWRASLILTSNTMRPYVRAIDVVGTSVYVGGNYNRIVGPDGVTRSAARLNRLSAVDGRPIRGFAANIGGAVYDIDATDTRLYAVGKFTTVNGELRDSLAILDPLTGTSIPGMKQMLFTTETASRWYQQAVVDMGDIVWVGGSEHSTQAYTSSDLTRLRIFTSNPLGDIQALAAVNGYLYGGSHANPSTFMYTDATHYTNLTGWTTKDPVKWIGAVDLENRTFVPTWTPSVGVNNGEGAWELFVDSDSCMWAGGDFKRGSSTSNGYLYAQGFTKFCPVDHTAPTTPATASATPAVSGVSLAWGASTDSAGGVRYEVLRNDRPIATGLTGRTFTDPTGTSTDRYFIRSIDGSGNRSATTPVVLVGPDAINPSTPQNLVGVPGLDGEAVLSWSASTDNVAVTGYAVFRNGVEVQTTATTTATVTGLPAGANSFQVAAVDGAGNVSTRTGLVTVTVTGADLVKPTSPKDLVIVPGADNEAVLTWTASTDNVGVTGYRIYRSGVLVQTVTDATTVTLTALPTGTNSFQVSAIDAAANESSKTASVTVMVTGVDVTKPSTPRDLVGTLLPSGDVELTWTASTDNVGVAGYTIFQTGAAVQTVAASPATISGLTTGTYFFQVQAFDAATNTSNKTASITVVIP